MDDDRHPLSAGSEAAAAGVAGTAAALFSEKGCRTSHNTKKPPLLPPHQGEFAGEKEGSKEEEMQQTFPAAASPTHRAPALQQQAVRGGLIQLLRWQRYVGLWKKHQPTEVSDVFFFIRMDLPEGRGTYEGLNHTQVAVAAAAAAAITAAVAVAITAAATAVAAAAEWGDLICLCLVDGR
ncbi:hypothetical protein ACSSS7_007513 [Eimeria intestinalis]